MAWPRCLVAGARHRAGRTAAGGAATVMPATTCAGATGDSYLVRYQNSGVSQNWVWLAMEACGPDSVFFHTAT